MNFKIKKQVVVTTTQEEEVEATLAEYIGYVISNRREFLKLNISEVSRLTMNSTVQSRGSIPGISATNIGNIERGITNPNINSLEILCDVLGIHISTLFPAPEVISSDVSSNNN